MSGHFMQCPQLVQLGALAETNIQELSHHRCELLGH